MFVQVLTNSDHDPGTLSHTHTSHHPGWPAACWSAPIAIIYYLFLKMAMVIPKLSPGWLPCKSFELETHKVPTRKCINAVGMLSILRGMGDRNTVGDGVGPRSTPAGAMAWNDSMTPLKKMNASPPAMLDTTTISTTPVQVQIMWSLRFLASSSSRALKLIGAAIVVAMLQSYCSTSRSTYGLLSAFAFFHICLLWWLKEFIPL